MQYPFDFISLAVADKLKDVLSRQYFVESMGIPLLAEEEQIKPFYEKLVSVLSRTSHSQLVFLFINEKENASVQVRSSNKRVLDYFSFQKEEMLKLLREKNHFIIIINGTLKNLHLKSKEGVGRARRVLGDLALFFHNSTKISSPLHRQSDADVRLPNDYFYAQLEKGVAAGTYPFSHTRGFLNEIEYAGLQSYESFLKSYVEGLKFAASPYAFWALGSTLIFDLKAYEKIRGFPNVQAGEDFYFLSKIQSQGKVLQINELSQNRDLEINLEIVGRHSTRVPFGTGRALERLEKGEQFERYPHEAFEKLKTVLVQLKELSDHKNIEEFFLRIPADEHFNLKELKKSFEGIFKQKASSKHYLRQIHQTFEGLQTFRWIREKTASLRDQKNYLENLAE